MAPHRQSTPLSNGDHSSGRGLLTSTLRRGTYARSILPANIRHPDIQDVVFVCNDYLLIREYRNNKFHDVALKDDFDAKICSARLLRPAESLLAVPASRPVNGSSVNGSSLMLTDGEGDVNMTADERQTPPDVIVLMLERGSRNSLAFLYARQTSGSGMWAEFDFINFQRPLPPPQEDRDGLQYRRHLAVDSKSRAMAVAASETNILLFRLKDRSQWPAGPIQDEVAPFNPIAEEKQLTVAGPIHKMEFLESPRSDPNLVILLVIVGFNNRKTLMHRWDWDSSKTLSEGLHAEWAQGFPLGKTLDPEILIMMPTSSETGFVVVTHGFMLLYTDILSGSPRVSHFRLPGEPSPDGRDNSVAASNFSTAVSLRWTAWAKPTRREDFVQENDHFYLCREDGMFQFFEMTKGSGVLFNTPIKMNLTTDTAFAVLEDDGASELVITSNGLFRVPVQQDPQFEQLFVDWSPLKQFECIKDASTMHTITCSSHVKDLYSNNLHRIYTAYRGDCHEIAIGPSDRLFTLITGNCLHLVSSAKADRSGVNDTRLYPFALQDNIDINVDKQLQRSFNQDTHTVCAASSPEGLLVQITPKAIRSMSLHSQPKTHDIGSMTEINFISMAAIDPSSFDTILVLQRDQQFLLQYMKGIAMDGEITFHPKRSSISVDAMRLLSEPTCVSINRMYSNDAVWAAVGTWSRELLLVKIGQGRSPYLAHKISTGESLVHSISFKHYEVDDKALTEIICGQRDGKLERLVIDTEYEKLERRDSIILGAGAVKADVSFDHVMATCDGKLHRAALHSKPSCEQLQFHQVALFDGIGYQHELGVVDVMALPRWYGADRGTVVVQTGNHPYVVHLSPDIQSVAVPYDFFISEYGDPDVSNVTHEPSHVLSTSLGTIVAYRYTRYFGNRRGRQEFARIGLLDSRKALEGRRNVDTDIVVGNCSGETIEHIMEWRTKSGLRKSNFIVVCTRHQRVKEGRQQIRGRFYLYGPAKDTGDHANELVQIHGRHYSNIVRSAAHVSSDTFVICAGKEIKMIQLTDKVGSPSRVTTAETNSAKLRSIGTNITVRDLGQGRMIFYVTTQETLEMFDEQFQHLGFGPGYLDTTGGLAVSGGKDPLIFLPTAGAVKGFREIQTTARPRPRDVESATNGSEDESTVSLQKVIDAPLQSNVVQIKAHPTRDNVFLGANRFGTFYQLRVVDEMEWQLLKFLQNMTEQDSGMAPFLFQEKRRFPLLRPTWRPNIGATEMHVSGNVLARLVGQGSGKLQAILAEAIPGELDKGLEHYVDRCKFLAEYARKAGIYWEDAKDSTPMFRAITAWLENVLSPPL